MKTLLVNLLAFLSILQIGCNAINQGDGTIGSIDKGNISKFSSLTIDGVFDVTINLNKDNKNIEIQGDINLLPLVDIKTDNDELQIRTIDDYKSENPIKLIINTDSIQKLSVDGVNAININNINSESFSLETSGVNIIALAGKVKDFTLISKGTDTINAKELISENAKLELFGVPKIKVYSLYILSVNSHNSPAEVTYYGHPKYVLKEPQYGNCQIAKEQ